MTTKMIQGPLGPMIPISDSSLIHHKQAWMPNGNLIIQTCGASGTGKTRSILQVLPSISNLFKVCVLTLVPDNPTNKAIETWCNDNIGAESYAEFRDPESAQSGIETFLADLNPEGAATGAGDSKLQKWAILIADDFMVDDRKSSPYRLCVMAVFRILRNMHCHSWFITQGYKNGCPPEIRTNANIRFIFKMGSVNDQEWAACDFEANGFGSKTDFFRAYQNMDSGGSFSYLLLVSKPGDPHVYVHKHNMGMQHLQDITHALDGSPVMPVIPVGSGCANLQEVSRLLELLKH